MNTIFMTKYLLNGSEYDFRFFSTLDNAMVFCNSNADDFVTNPLVEGEGWLIEEHTVDNPSAPISYFNAKGKGIEGAVYNR